MFNKVKEFLNRKSSKALALTATATGLLTGTCFATEGGASLSSGLDFTPIITSFTDKITPADIVTVIAATITAGMLFVLAWFGIRKVVKALKNAIMRGRISM